MTKLVCLHHAGGSASIFRPWQRYASPGIEVVPISLPAEWRESGRARPGRLEELVPILADLVRKQVGGDDFVLFGKSMGGLLAYLLTRHFDECGDVPPKALAIASFGAPHMPWRDFTEGYGDDRELVRHLHEIGSVPEWVVEHPEWVTPYLGRLREDARLCAAYRFRPQSDPLAMPVRVFAGDRDPLVSTEAVHSWPELGRDVEVRILPGGHFLVSEDIGLLRQSVFSLTSTMQTSDYGGEPAMWRTVGPS
ncbi:thioesterase II family protein [Streptomyces sp. NPDC012623]|uniref:thioesterase II family protein n=1 Tax=unclassified Streptomyces TaxID=2593676 RepID=UPI00367F02B8